MLSRIITKLVAWAVAVFYDVERTGPALAEGPVLVTANHPNALVDPLVVFRTCHRPARPLAKAPLFEQVMVGTILRGLGGLPVYRKEDGPDTMHLNEHTFDAAVESLARGEAVQIYPEGKSHSDPFLAPIRTGAARIALLAEERAGWTLGLRVQPVGLTYTRKHLFRGRAVAAYGEPIAVGSLRDLYESDPREAVRVLTETIRERLEGLTLNLEEVGDRELVEVAERLYAREKGFAGWRERDPLAERLPRLQRFSEGLRWIRANDPGGYAELHQAMRTYMRLLTLLGAHEGDVPPRYRLGPVLRYTLTQALMLLLILPVAVVGTVLWAPPYLGVRHLAPRFRPKLDQVATYKLALGILTFPLWYLLLVAGAWVPWGLPGGAAVALGAPVVGLATVTWREREHRVREDARVFLRTVRSPRGKGRLREARAWLVGEFDHVAAAMRAAEDPSER